MSKPADCRCEICGLNYPVDEVVGEGILRPAIKDAVKNERQSWNSDSMICNNCLDRFRTDQLKKLLEEELGELTALDEQVLTSLTEHDLITKNPNEKFHEKLTFGQYLSDKLASFGGSWSFLIIFMAFLASWILFNQVGPRRDEFDPYPYILLNLILSCLAAIQAPIIMMSQNRQEAKDRIRSENDYLVNLKAELEIRQLHMKIDQLLKHQWKRLLEIQELQIELMKENLKRSQK